jgi:hypothetical protein
VIDPDRWIAMPSMSSASWLARTVASYDTVVVSHAARMREAPARETVSPGGYARV